MQEFDVFARAIADYGPPSHPIAVSAETAEAFRGRIPKEFIDFWLAYGWGSYKNGQVRFCDPRPFDPLLDLIFRGDPEFDPKDLTVLAFTSYSTLSVWDLGGRSMLIHMERSEVFAPPFSSMINPDTGLPYSNAFLSGLIIYDDLSVDELQSHTEAFEKLGRLAPDEVYGYAPALQLGGAEDLENLYRFKVIEHLTFLAQLEPLMLTELTDPQPGAPLGQMRNVRRIGPQ